MSRQNTEAPAADALTRTLMDAFEDILARFVTPGAPYALVDFPNHYNVGDSAIYTGELVFFDSYIGRPADYVCDLDDYRRDIEKFCPEGPILIHGGGNFGDVWEVHQAFRLALMEHYPDRQIVQLGQSMHWNDPAARDETARAIEKHGNFNLLVRDQNSFDEAKAHFQCEVFLCPDAAHNMWHLPAPAPHKHEVLSILRKDREQRGDAVRDLLAEKGPIHDWERQFWAKSPLDRIYTKAIVPYVAPTHGMMRHRERMFRRQAWNRVNYGVRLLSEGKVIVSDRLHAHIMSSLMRKPHLTLDNYYGKISRYIEAWGDDGLTTRVSDSAQLKAALAAQGL